MNTYQQISAHHTALAFLFRKQGRKEQAEYHEGMARIYERRAAEEA
jgi:hypothetical protein